MCVEHSRSLSGVQFSVQFRKPVLCSVQSLKKRAAIAIQPFDLLNCITMRCFELIEFGKEAECCFNSGGAARDICDH
ncbi:MAG: hypothetical protein ABSF87_17175 [Xanthobacteraceae bacterium]|jgi:hypothetical protein